MLAGKTGGSKSKPGSDTKPRRARTDLSSADHVEGQRQDGGHPFAKHLPGCVCVGAGFVAGENVSSGSGTSRCRPRAGREDGGHTGAARARGRAWEDTAGGGPSVTRNRGPGVPPRRPYLRRPLSMQHRSPQLLLPSSFSTSAPSGGPMAPATRSGSSTGAGCWVPGPPHTPPGERKCGPRGGARAPSNQRSALSRPFRRRPRKAGSRKPVPLGDGLLFCFTAALAVKRTPWEGLVSLGLLCTGFRAPAS